MGTESLASIRSALGSTDIEELARLIRRYQRDPRTGVREAVASAHRRLARARAEAERLRALAEVEEQLFEQGLTMVAGVDEVGRGALAGPVTAAACILPRGASIPGLADSKTVPPDLRVSLDAAIRAIAIGVSIAHVDSTDIDRIGIAGATVLAMSRAVSALTVSVDHALVDGLPVKLPVPSTAFVKGDGKVRAIAAASILAKVARDALMRELDAVHPGYYLADNKGYGSPEHLSALSSRGPCAIHRKSFAPCNPDRLFWDV